METLAFAAAYLAYEDAHDFDSQESEILEVFQSLKNAINSHCLAYVGLLVFCSQVLLNAGAIAAASFPIKDAIVNTQSSCLNVRATPNTNSNKVTCLSRGTALEVVGEQGGWYQLQTGNWVSKEFVAVPSSAMTQQPSTVPENNIASTAVDLEYVESDMMQGQAVIDLQTRLNDYKLLDRFLVVDGVFGRKTHAAVVAFQEQKGLDMDGIVGSETKEALGL